MSAPEGAAAEQAADLSADAPGFSRALGAADLTGFGFGAIIGAGIFVVSGTAAAQFAGPAIVLSFLIAGVGCTAVALCFAELSAMMPEVGGVYRYSRQAFGHFAAWLVAWDLIAEFLLGTATIGVSWSADLVAFLRETGVALPAWLTQSPVAAEYGAQISRVPGGGINLPAVLLILALTAVLVGGIRLTARVNMVAVVIKLAVLAAIVVFGFFYVNPAYWHPFIPANSGTFGRFGWSGVIRGVAAVFFAFIGFDAIAMLTQEARAPRREAPAAMLVSLLTCIVVYAAMGAVMTGLAPFRDLNMPHPLLGTVGAAGSPLHWLTLPIRIAIIAGLSSVALVLLLAQPRLLFAMARDGLAPASFARVHPTRRIPVAATVASGVAAALLAGVAPLGLLLETVSAATLVSFAVVCVAVPVLRYRLPNAPRPFRIPLGPLAPVVGLAFVIGVMATIQFETWIRLTLWLVAGVAVYFVYARSASRRRAFIDRAVAP